MKYIIQIIGGLGLLLMLSMCVQAGMLSHADIQNRASDSSSSDSADSSDPDASGTRSDYRSAPPPVMSEKDPTPEDFAKESSE